MKTATRKQFLARAKELNITVEEDDGSKLEIFTPPGMVLAAMGTHGSCIYVQDGPWNMPDAYQALIDDMAMGLEPCPNGIHCAWCYDSTKVKGK